MRQTRPLPDTHPEFTVLYWPGFTEYRVEHWWIARDGSGRIVRGTCVWSWIDAVVVVIFAVVLAWSGVIGGERLLPVPRPVLVVGIGITLTYLVWARFTQVLHESLLVFPTLGIQLETHRGHPLFPLSLATTRHFIPLSALEDVVLHEGFRRWNVRYYLAALKRTRGACMVHEAFGAFTTGTGDRDRDECACGVEVRVAFENVLPYFPVLKVVYLGVQETLFPPPTRAVQTDG
ncbi:hypothetical protein HD554DRAFT_1053 [Boletus coccyginus]|nr:hypothetical protein HD554DRAFT_1053 [Boletus coccyginus]